VAMDNRSPYVATADRGDLRVVHLHEPPDPISADAYSGPEAAEAARISYRQLDYWARRNWVVPSGAASEGMQRRVYTVADVVRLAALGHLGRSRVDVATYGPATGRLQVPAGSAYLIVWAIHDENVRLTNGKDLRRVACEPGRYVIFDPAPLLRNLARRRSEAVEVRPRRRTFTAEYKLAVLAEYERLTEPGAKGALLRREALHTSHLVAWRRGRETSELRERVRPPGRTTRAERPAGVAGDRWSAFKGTAVVATAVHRPA